MKIRSRLHTAVAVFFLSSGRVIVIAFCIITNKIVNLSVRAEEICILLYIQQDATLHSLFYLETALHVSGSTTHHQEHIQLYLQHLVLSNRYCYLPL
jgi:hypothetical protein